MVLSQLPLLKKIWPDFLTKAIDTISILSVIARYDTKQGIVTVILLSLILTYSVLPLNAMAEHGTQTWNAAIRSVVIVNPTWPGYTKPGFGAPAGTAPAGSGVYFSENEPTSKYILTAAHVISRATDIEIVDYSGRTVISVDPNIDIDEYGIPLKVAMNVTFPEKVTKFNIDRLTKYLENGSAYYAPAASGVQMAESYLKDLKKKLPCAVHLNGEYGASDIYAGVPVIIGSGGVEKIIELELNSEEKKNFEKSVESVKDLFNVARKIDPSL